MSRKLNMRKSTGLAASLMFASATIFGTAASAAKLPPRDPVCEQQVANACVATWQPLGYGNYQHCVAHQTCMQCPPSYGYLCGIGPNATKPDAATEPW